MLGQPWPRSVVDLIDYLRDAMSQDGATKTPPGQVAAAMSFREKGGGVRLADRITQSSVWQAAVRDAEVRMQQGAPPAKQAPRFPLALVVALEALVVDPAYPMFKRLVAWARLLKV